ncbi:DUF6510 family protein [Symbioplanes lichenis]|uniref:DUF6510 family protein n=1 Tax=Symbioplanes lichenis TaxID=1629072 RepID=UPI00273A48B2|nr:DUF6510 family protein [Actinoplanes lichenis]
MSSEVDGNALGGDLAEIFAVDLTGAAVTCGGCKTVSAVAALLVWGPAPGLVARCPECEDVVLRLVRAPGQAWLDLRGAVSVRIPLPAPE